MKAIRTHEFGGPEILGYEDVEIPEPGPGQARVKLAASGVNFIDVYQRTGRYPGDLPRTLGLEGAGEVDAVGEGVDEVSPGDYVAFASTPGSYAEYVGAPAENLVPFNATLVEPRVAAAAMLQGMTAHYLTHSTFPLEEGQTALVHAAAGGVGLLLCQMAKLRGATVIGTAGVEETRRLTDGEGVHVVYDSVGKDTFDGSLDCLRPRGYMVLFGASSGPVPPLDLQILNQKGGLFLTRPALVQYTATREELLSRAESLFSWIGQNNLD